MAKSKINAKQRAAHELSNLRDERARILGTGKYEGKGTKERGLYRNPTYKGGNKIKRLKEVNSRIATLEGRNKSIKKTTSTKSTKSSGTKLKMNLQMFAKKGTTTSKGKSGGNGNKGK